MPVQIKRLTARLADLESRVEGLETWRGTIEAWRTVSEGEAEQRQKILKNISLQMDQVRSQLAALLQHQP